MTFVTSFTSNVSTSGVIVIHRVRTVTNILFLQSVYLFGPNKHFFLLRLNKGSFCQTVSQENAPGVFWRVFKPKQKPFQRKPSNDKKGDLGFLLSFLASDNTWI